MCPSQGCNFWYQASHCLQHFVETAVPLQAYFFQKMQELLRQPLFGNITFCFYTVQKRFHAFAIEAFTTHAKKGHHHFFDLMRTLYVDTSLSSQDTTKFLPSVSKSKDTLGFFASVVLLATGAPWKRFC